MSPRRSSRARTAHANPRPSPQTASSTSSSTLKHVISNQRSESTEEPVEDSESQATEPIMATRRSRRYVGDESSKESPQRKEVDGEEDLVEEEVTRCICGQIDYPGPSDPLRQMVKGQPSEEFGDELGSFFVCCDKCSVWQHGGCVGLTNEDTLPDEYYCEQCKPELHKLIRGANGSKISLYRPVLDPPEEPPRSASTTSEQRKSSKASKNSEPTKRRATMNSRGAYDEDEMLRRAIEESKHDGTGTGTGAGAGALGKRTREEDESKQVVKRQRTSSSSSGSKDRSQSPGAAEPASKTKTNLRGAAARNSREKELRDKVRADAAAAKAEAANRRNARSERRRGEDSPPPTPSLSPSKGPHGKAKAMARTGSTSPSLAQNKKKTAASRLAASRRGRLGRNQFTRDRDVDSETPNRDTSHDRNGVDHSPGHGHSEANGGGGGGGGGGAKAPGFVGGSGRQSKAKTHPARTSMNEMKRRVAAILEFVGQMQTRASTDASNTSNSGKDSPNSNGSGKGQGPTVSGLVKAVQAATEAKHAAGQDREVSDDGANGKLRLRDDAEFRTMGSVEMMETLTKELVNWQSLYGVWSR